MVATMTDLKVERAAKTLRTLTLDKLRKAIVSLRFRPGERLVERDLCAQLGVSRTVVREVLRHLETEGYVETSGHRGPVVAKSTPEDARQIYELRALLEGLAARACAEQATPEIVRKLEAALDAIRAGYAQQSPARVLAATNDFYNTLFEGAGRTVALTIVQSLYSRINHLRALTIATPGRGEAGPPQMRKIIEAIEARDGEAAAKACADHIAQAAALAQAALREEAGDAVARR